MDFKGPFQHKSLYYMILCGPLPLSHPPFSVMPPVILIRSLLSGQRSFRNVRISFLSLPGPAFYVLSLTTQPDLVQGGLWHLEQEMRFKEMLRALHVLLCCGTTGQTSHKKKVTEQLEEGRMHLGRCVSTCLVGCSGGDVGVRSAAEVTTSCQEASWWEVGTRAVVHYTHSQSSIPPGS